MNEQNVEIVCCRVNCYGTSFFYQMETLMKNIDYSCEYQYFENYAC